MVGKHPTDCNRSMWNWGDKEDYIGENLMNFDASLKRKAAGHQWCIQEDRRRASGGCGRAVPVQGGVVNPQVSMQRADPVSGGFPHLQQPPRACAGRAWQVQTIGARPAPAHNPACAHPDGLLRSLMAVEVGGPVVHQDTPALEQVRAGIGRLDPVPDHMRQGRLDHLPGISDGRSKQTTVLLSYIYIASSSV